MQSLRFSTSPTSLASSSLLVKVRTGSTIFSARTPKHHKYKARMMSNINLSSTANEEDYRFPLMRLPVELRLVIYRKALDHALPSLILARGVRGMHRWHEYSTGHQAATGRPAAGSFTNLQLSNRQFYQEASYILYQNCQFSFDIAPGHASFLDECLLSRFPTRVIQDKSYVHKRTNIVLKANWDQYDWAEIRSFSWTHWKDITLMVCREMEGFTGMRRLTLDWRVPDPCDGLQPTKCQWLSISPYFERLQASRPDICIKVLVWQIIPGSVTPRYQEIRKSFEEYTQELLRATKRPQHTPVSLLNPSYVSFQWPPISNRLSYRPVILPNSSHSSYR